MTPRIPSGKTLTEPQRLGGLGINLIERLVTEMGFVWRPTAVHDVGIDGEIEVRDPASGRMAGFIIKVQSKAFSEFEGDTADSCCLYAKTADVEYWRQANVPVLLVVSKPSTGEAYWICVQEYFRSMPLGASKFSFLKSKDRLNQAARERLARLVMRQYPGFYEPAPRMAETLLINLLAVTRLPPRIYVAPTEHRDPLTLIKTLVQKDIRFGREWLLKDKVLLSAHNLVEHPFDLVCDAGAADHYDVKEWSNTEDEAKKRDFVQLLSRCLREHMRQLGMVYVQDKPFECYFFRPPRGETERRYRYRTDKRWSSRKMVTVSRKKDGTVRYYKHHAFKARFHRFGLAWFLQITPTYFFTDDGMRLYPYYEEPLKWHKEHENNNAVRGQLATWVRILTAETDMIGKPYPYLGFEEPREFSYSVGLDDKKWLSLSESAVADSAPADDTQIGLELQ